MRSVSQIYSEAVATRNDYLQITELNSGRSNSKLSIINLLTYVMAVCIHTYEAILDVFQVRIAEALNGRINGTPDWYAATAKKFQYNPATSTGDEIVFNEDTMKVEYATVNVSHRIIEKAAWQIDDTTGYLTLKVCKANNNSNELNNGTPYMQLNDYELTAFRSFVQQIKFVGANVFSESSPGDILTIVADANSPIFYNDSYVTASQALTKIQNAMIDFSNGIEFNGYLYYQAIIDALQKTEYIVDISRGVKVYIKSYNSDTKQYNDNVELTSRMRLKSGYLKLMGEDSAITINSSNITLIPSSRMDEYIQSLNQTNGNNENTDENGDTNTENPATVIE